MPFQWHCLQANKHNLLKLRWERSSSEKSLNLLPNLLQHQHQSQKWLKKSPNLKWNLYPSQLIRFRYRQNPFHSHRLIPFLCLLLKYRQKKRNSRMRLKLTMQHKTPLLEHLDHNSFQKHNPCLHLNLLLNHNRTLLKQLQNLSKK